MNKNLQEKLNIIEEIKTNKNLKELCRLIIENPELEVIPMVDSEIAGATMGYWYIMGNWGEVKIREYWEEKDGDGTIFFKDIQEDLVIDIFMCELDAEEGEREKIKKMIPWTKAIFVEIEP